MASRYFAVIALLEVTDDEVSHEQLYNLLPKLEHPGIKEIYTDIDPSPARYEVLRENAGVDLSTDDSDKD